MSEPTKLTAEQTIQSIQAWGKGNHGDYREARLNLENYVRAAVEERDQEIERLKESARAAMSVGPPRVGQCDKHHLHRLPCPLCANELDRLTPSHPEPAARPPLDALAS